MVVPDPKRAPDVIRPQYVGLRPFNLQSDEETIMALAPLLIADPVRTDELWRRYQIGKAEAFRLWQCGECAGQIWNKMLVLSRSDVKRIAEKESPSQGLD
jgi:hypothetical protein